MGFVLKQYQRDCLDRLTDFLRRARESGNADTAFWEMTRRNPVQPPEELQGMPYVCLKVPTGGGKTFLAAHAVKPACEHWLQRERGVVLWLAPTTQIVDQTLDALRTPGHPYREALNEAFDGQVSVYDLGGALHVTPQVLSGSTTIIVTTIQAHRVREEVKRRVSEANERLKEHFEFATPEQRAVIRELSGGEESPLSPSLLNVLRMHRPMVIVDEAHNARSDLSFETLARFNPSCIVEFTATPREDSNVLHAVSAAELKAEEMIKLPIRMRACDAGRDAIFNALSRRKELEALAEQRRKAGAEYVRPIVLYQAENEKGALNPEAIKRMLIEECKVDASEVAICTGSTDELPEEPILSESNPVRHIITIQKLREGWDCPFAYVLCSVASLSSQVAVEQILGRVLRMPHARKRDAAELNNAYAFVTSSDFRRAAEELEEAIVKSGFTRYEAERALVEEPAPDDPSGLFGQVGRERVSVTVSTRPDIASVPEKEREFVSVTERAGQVEVAWEGPAMSREAAKALAESVTSDSDRTEIERLRRRTAGEEASPAAMGERFRIRNLAVRDEDGQWQLLTDQPLEGEWDLTQWNHELSDSEFRLPRAGEHEAIIDVNQRGDAVHRFVAAMDRQLVMLDTGAPKTAAELALWLDRAIRDRYLLPAQKRDFLLRMVNHLIDERGLTIEELSRHRFRLKEAAAGKIAAHRTSEEHSAYQHLLNDAAVIDECYVEFPANYPANEFYPKPEQFEKHFYTDIGEMNGEEARVAGFIDMQPEVEFWVRNLERPPFFHLRMPHGNFYPDFVAKLIDDRVMVIESKGAHLSGGERDRTPEKRGVGEIWQGRGEGDHLFAIVGADDYERTIRDLIDGS